MEAKRRNQKFNPYAFVVMLYQEIFCRFIIFLLLFFMNLFYATDLYVKGRRGFFLTFKKTFNFILIYFNIYPTSYFSSYSILCTFILFSVDRMNCLTGTVLNARTNRPPSRLRLLFSCCLCHIFHIYCTYFQG